MKICIIGNSHTSALKQAWMATNVWHETIELVFFAAPGDMLKALSIDENSLYTEDEALKSAVMHTSGGLERICPADFDAILIYGSECRPFLKPTRFYTNAVLNLAMEDHGKNTLSFSILQMLKELTSKKIYIGHQPLPALERNTATIKNNSNCAEAYKDSCQLINSSFYESYNTQLVMQPVHTIVDGRYTHIDFCRGSRRLPLADGVNEGYHPENDYVHMNDKYGKLWLECFFSEYLGLPVLNDDSILLAS